MQTLTWFDLTWCLIPLAIGLLAFWHMQASPKDLLIASARMLLQLIGVGFVLVVLFDTDHAGITLLVLLIMALIASWIALRPIRSVKGTLGITLLSLGVSSGLHLLLTIVLVLQLDNWHQVQVVIPLAGMYLANTMNSISLALERFYSALGQNHAPKSAARVAFKAAMIPQINTLLAVGLVALPGMMTGQILAGVSPLIAVRYQIMIMTMLLGASSLGVLLALHLCRAKVVARQS